jgi:hypothetical protein
MLEPGVYLDSPYMASVISALAVSNPAAPEGVPARARRSLFGIEGPLFTPDKTWLAALAFAAGVAVTWFAYDPEPEGEAVSASELREDREIRTLSVDDLPRVEEDLPRIIHTSQLPRAADDDEAVAPASARPAAGNERRAVPTPRMPAQRVHALAPAAPKRAAPRASAPRASAARAPSLRASAPSPRAKSSAAKAPTDCNPPYDFDSKGIRRLKSECLNGTGVIQGPYGAVITTNVSAKAGSGKRSSEKQARASRGCTPPYYFDGKIRRVKVECL